MASLREQLYENFRVVIVGFEPREAYQDPRVTTSWWRGSRGKLVVDERYVICVEAGDAVAPQALALVTEELARFPQAKLFYSDELIVDGEATAPSFKPSWSPFFAASRPYLGRSVFLSASEFPDGLIPLDAASFERCALAIATKSAAVEMVPFAALPAHARGRRKRQIVRTSADFRRSARCTRRRLYRSFFPRAIARIC